MRIKPVRSRPVPLGSGFLALKSGEQAPKQCGLPHRAQFESIQLEPAVHEVGGELLSQLYYAHFHTAAQSARLLDGQGGQLQVTVVVEPLIALSVLATILYFTHACSLWSAA